MFSLLRHIVDKMMLIRNCIKQRLRNIIFAFSVIDPRSGEEKKSANIGIDKKEVLSNDNFIGRILNIEYQERTLSYD